jgi:hypothetical protein
MTNRTSDFVVWNLPDSQPAIAGDIANSAKFCLCLRSPKMGTDLLNFVCCDSQILVCNTTFRLPAHQGETRSRLTISGPGAVATDQPTNLTSVPQPCTPLWAVSKRGDTMRTAGNHHEIGVGSFPRAEKSQRAFSAAANCRHLPTTGVPTGQGRLSVACSLWCSPDRPRLAILKIAGLLDGRCQRPKSRKAAESDDGHRAAKQLWQSITPITMPP